MRSHIVQKFSSPGDGGSAKVAILNITPVPSNLRGLSEKELSEILFDPSQIESQLPKSSKLITAKPTTYDNEPGIFIYYVTQLSRSGVDLASLMVSHRFLYKNSTVDLTIAYSTLITPAQKNITQQQSDSFLGLALLMGNSIILPDNYNTN